MKKIKFTVHHTYGLSHEELFSLEELSIKNIPIENISKDNKQLADKIEPLLIDWTKKHYNHGDALPGWEVVNVD